MWSILLSSGLFLTALQMCVSHCPSGTFANKASGQCEDCSKGCVVCRDTQQCNRCLSGLYLQNGVCVVECQRYLSCFLMSWLAREHVPSWYTKATPFSPLTAVFPEGFLKVVNASCVPLSVHPVREIPLTVWAVTGSTSCWTTPVGHVVQRAIIRQTQNAIDAPLSVRTAIRTASVRVCIFKCNVCFNVSRVVLVIIPLGKNVPTLDIHPYD